MSSGNDRLYASRRSGSSRWLPNWCIQAFKPKQSNDTGAQAATNPAGLQKPGAGQFKSDETQEYSDGRITIEQFIAVYMTL